MILLEIGLYFVVLGYLFLGTFIYVIWSILSLFNGYLFTGGMFNPLRVLAYVLLWPLLFWGDFRRFNNFAYPPMRR
jgi:hypothetical protein